MAIFHCQAKAISRSSGRSATASAAYRSGESITDRRTGEVYDYEKKHGIEYKKILTPDDSEIERSELWNRAEEAEKRKDAKVAREWEIALPSELTHKQRVDLACQFAHELVKRYGVAADVCLHVPGRGGDQRNHHAHILTTTRTYEAGVLGEKTRVLDSPRTSGQEVESMRQTWAHLANRALEKAGYAERIDARSLKSQGIGREPTHHLGPVATAMERRGIKTERGDLNRSLLQGLSQDERDELAALEKQQAGICVARSRVKQWQEDQERAAEAQRQKEKELERKVEFERYWKELSAKVEADMAREKRMKAEELEREKRQKERGRERDGGWGR